MSKNTPYHFLDVHGITDKGQVRKQNQDDILVSHDDGLFVVADGVGGLDGGQLASQSISSSLKDLCGERATDYCYSNLEEKEEAVKLRLLQVNDWLISQDKPEENFRPCSTVTLMIFGHDHPDRFSTLHAGDSNLYLLRAGLIQSLLQPHEAGGGGNAISRAVGANPTLEVEHNSFLIKPDDYYLICSDGLYRMLTEQEIADVFRQHRDEGVKSIAETLVEYANLAGGADNISVVVVYVSPDHADATPECYGEETQPG